MRRVAGPYVLAVGGVGAALLVLGWVVGNLPDGSRGQFLVEVAKASLGIVPLAFFGVVISEMIRRRDLERAHQDQRRQAQLDVRHRAIDAYNKMKSARRLLRAAGLRPDADIEVDDVGLGRLDEQMRLLMDAQLTFERLKREMRAETAPFRARKAIHDGFEKLEKAINRIVKEWEAGRPRLVAPLGPQEFASWPDYSALVIDASSSEDAAISILFAELDQALIAELAMDAPSSGTRTRAWPRTRA